MSDEHFYPRFAPRERFTGWQRFVLYVVLVVVVPLFGGLLGMSVGEVVSTAGYDNDISLPEIIGLALGLLLPLIALLIGIVVIEARIRRGRP